MRLASRMVERRWAMTNEVRSLSSSSQRLLDDHLGLRVDVGRRLVEDEDARLRRGSRGRS